MHLTAPPNMPAPPWVFHEGVLRKYLKCVGFGGQLKELIKSLVATEVKSTFPVKKSTNKSFGPTDILKIITLS
jgi:hypothetical protein